MDSLGNLLVLPGSALKRLDISGEAKELKVCAQAVLSGFLKIPDMRAERFLGKVSDNEIICRGGSKSLQFQMTPWVDWSQYWGFR